ncbi:MAG: carbohydrate porin, partial [Vulcanococcus sp.]
VWPSVYTGDKILKLFQFAGAPGANTQVLGAGAGAYWKEGKKGGWSFGLNYVAGEGDVGDPNRGGIGNGNSKASGSAQLAYTGKNWNLSGLYTYNNRGVSMRGTPFASSAFSTGFGGTNSFGLAGYWQPLQSGWVPSISAGWGINVSNDIGGTRLDPSTGDSLTTQSWMVGLNWKDAFMKGNVLGMAVGQAPFVTATYDSDTLGPWDGNYAWEWYYKFQVSDNIAVTPAIFYVSRPQGQFTGNGNSFDSFGYLIQTTFKF